MFRKNYLFENEKSTKTLMRPLITFLLFVLIASTSFAQKFSLSLDAQVGIPQQEYQATNGDAGYGLRVNFLYKPLPAVPLKFGIEAGFMEKGRASQYFSGYSYGYYDEFKVSATNNIVSLMVLTRFQTPTFWKIKPFLDLTAGWNVFFSTVSVERVTYYSPYNDTYSNSSKALWALTYGATGGLDIPLNRRDDVGLELKVSYLIGNNSRYLTDPYIDNNGHASFVEKNSRTNMLIPQAGVRITIR
jgi:hypothetical protein